MNSGTRTSGLGILPRLQAILVTVMSVAVTVFLVDLVAFFVLDLKVPGYRPERFFTFSPVLGWFHRPGARGNWYPYDDGTRHRVEINSYGFADRERSLDKSRPRIALLGDSTTEFWEVEEAERGHIRIEGLLGGEYEVLNFGVRAYGTDQTYLLFQLLGVEFSPDIVVYTFCINDIDDNSRSVSKPYFRLAPEFPDGIDATGYPMRPESGPAQLRAPTSLASYSFTVRTIKAAADYLGDRFAPAVQTGAGPAQRTGREPHFALRPYKRVYDEDDRRRMDITLRLISRLDRLARERGMRFLLVEGLLKPVLDPALQGEVRRLYGDQFEFGKVSRLLSEYTRSRGIPFLSLPELLRQQGLRVSDLMHHSDPVHLNREGVKWYSAAVVDRLRALGWIQSNVSRYTPGP